MFSCIFKVPQQLRTIKIEKYKKMSLKKYDV